jgi:hypothetical protein
MHATFKHLSAGLADFDAFGDVTVERIWQGLLARVCDEAAVEVQRECLEGIEATMAATTTVPQAEEMQKSIIERRAECGEDANRRLLDACNRHCKELARQLRSDGNPTREHFDHIRLRLVTDVQEKLWLRSRQRLEELQRMVADLE